MSDEAPLRIDSNALGIDDRERRCRLGRLALLASGLLLAATNLLAFALNSPTPCLVGMVTPFTALASLGVLIGAALQGLPHLEYGSLTIEGGVLSLQFRHLGALRQIAITDIVQGWCEEPDRVHLALRNGEILVIQVPDATLREHLLRAVGVTAAERILRVPLASAASQLFGGTTFAVLVLITILTALLFAVTAFAVGIRSARADEQWPTLGVLTLIAMVIAALSAAGYGVFSLIQRREAVVGAEGVAVQQSIRRRLIPYASVTHVTLDTRGVRLDLRGGERVVLPTRSALKKMLWARDPEGELPGNETETRRRLLFNRIKEAMALGGNGAAPNLGQLDRGERSVASWREALLGLARSADGYRNRALSSGELGGVIEDPAAPIERRIAAAVALSAREPDEARKRVRIAARACADEGLAAALEQAAEGEIAEALLEREVSRRAIVERGG